MGALISIFSNQFKAPQGWSFEACCQWALYLMCKSLPYYLHLVHSHWPAGRQSCLMTGDGRSSLVIECRNSNPTILGSIPWWGRVKDGFSVPPSQHLCRLLCAWPPFVCKAHTQMCVHVKDPVAICRKRVGLKASGMDTQKHCTQEQTNQKSWVVPY